MSASLDYLRKFLRDKPIMRPVRLMRLGREARGGGHTDWSPVLTKDQERWNEARSNARGPRVLIASNVGLNFATSRIDSLLGVALTLRGAQVDYLLCDEALPACQAASTSWFSEHKKFEQDGLKRDICRHCFEPALDKLAPLNLTIHRLGAHLDDQDRDAIESWLEGVDLSNPHSIEMDGIAIVEHALSGTLRYLARGTLKERHMPILRAYLRAARLTQLAVTRLAEKNDYDVALMHHGIYIPQGTTAAVLRQSGTRIATWFPTYRKKCFIFSHDDTYHRTMLTEPTEMWDQLEFDSAMEDKISAYLKSRWTGSQDWITFHRDPDFDFETFADKRGLDVNKPIIGLLTNVFWDAQLHYPESTFSSMREWLVETVRYFEKRKDLQLIIRVHPAEITGTMPARETAISILEEDIGELPDNVFVVGPEDTMSTYILASHCKACLIYATKAGIELLSSGIPVIAAGEAWVKGKDMALDAYDWDGYFDHLDSLPEVTMPENFQNRALRYAYHFFFRRMIPIKVVKPVPAWPPYEIDVASLSQLEHGADAGLDVICDGLLKEEPFIYPAERLEGGASNS